MIIRQGRVVHRAGTFMEMIVWELDTEGKEDYAGEIDEVKKCLKDMYSICKNVLNTKICLEARKQLVVLYRQKTFELLRDHSDLIKK